MRGATKLSEMTSTLEAPNLTYDGMTVGDVFVDTSITVTAEAIAEFRRTIRVGAGSLGVGGDRFAPPTMAAMWTVPRVMFNEWNVPVGGIHARQSWRFMKFIQAGTELRVLICLKEKFIRKERPWVVFQSRLTDGNREEVASGEMTLVWPT